MEFTIDKFAKEVAEKALDEIIYEGKTIREWTEILAKLQLSEDCISRKDTIEWLKKITVTDGIEFKTGFEQILYDIEQMPPVKPERPKGKWIEVLEWRTEFSSAWHYECSECRARSYKGYKPLERYCPNCGAEMSGGIKDD